MSCKEAQGDIYKVCEDSSSTTALCLAVPFLPASLQNLLLLQSDLLIGSSSDATTMLVRPGLSLFTMTMLCRLAATSG